MKISIVIPAGGAGRRLGGEVPKQFLELGGEPILRRTLNIFAAMEIVAEIAVAVPKEFLREVETWGISKPLHIVAGEKTRAESVFAALKILREKNIVLIHDGIRPFVTPEIISAVALAAEKHGAAIACAPVTDTIKEADSGEIIATHDRTKLWRAQTPQGFTYEIISRAYEQAAADGVLASATDDSALVERIGIPVKIVESTRENIKITTAADLRIAGALL